MEVEQQSGTPEQHQFDPGQSDPKVLTRRQQRISLLHEKIRQMESENVFSTERRMELKQLREKLRNDKKNENRKQKAKPTQIEPSAPVVVPQAQVDPNEGLSGVNEQEEVKQSQQSDVNPSQPDQSSDSPPEEPRPQIEEQQQDKQDSVFNEPEEQMAEPEEEQRQDVFDQKVQMMIQSFDRNDEIDKPSEQVHEQSNGAFYEEQAHDDGDAVSHSSKITLKPRHQDAERGFYPVEELSKLVSTPSSNERGQGIIERYLANYKNVTRANRSRRTMVSECLMKNFYQ